MKGGDDMSIQNWSLSGKIAVVLWVLFGFTLLRELVTTPYRGRMTVLSRQALPTVPSHVVIPLEKAQIDPRSINPVLLAAGFSSGQRAYFTGNSHPTKLLDETWGYACEYRAPNGKLFWEAFREWCPSSVDI